MTTPEPPVLGERGQTGAPGYYFRTPPRDDPPAPRRRRWIWWLLGSLVAVALIGGLIATLAVFLARNIGPARDATNEYFAAVTAQDWVTAQAHLDASLRASVKPTDLQATWTRRTQAEGPVDRFAVT